MDMDKQSIENNEDLPVLQYYVAKRNTVLSRISGSCDVNISTLRLGMLVEVIKVEKDGALRVRVNDFTGSEVWQKTEWLCHKFDLISVPSIIWQFLIAVPIPQERVHLASNKLLCEEIKDIRLNSKVWYRADLGGTLKILAVVKFIGPVPELGHGFYFGLDLLDNQEYSKTSTLTQQYFTCIYSNGTFATLSNVCPFKMEASNTENSEKMSFSKNEVAPNKQIDDLSNNSGNAYSHNRKKIGQDLNVTHIKRFSTFDDSKNNNRDIVSASKDPLVYKSTHQLPKTSTLQSDTSSLNHNINSYGLFNSEHKWSSDIDSNTYSDLEATNDFISSYHNGIPEKDESSKIVRTENTGDLRVGSAVKVLLDTGTHHGVIRWIGTPPGITPGRLMTAVELEEGHPFGTDGTYNDVRYFHCMPHRAVFTDIKQCLQCDAISVDDRNKVIVDHFGNMESSVIMGMVRPISVKGDLESICGKYRGIQGHHNSCYLDATLFSMFTFTSVFDNLLFRPPNEKDCPQYEEVQRVLREEIVNPLRKNMFVRADRVMKLRTLLEKLSSVSGLTSEEKDPEEFLTSLVAQILNAEPFLKLSSGQDAYHYQLFVEKDDHLNLPTVQQLLEQSFLTSNIRLKEVPSCLIIQMPRFGKSFKMYQKIQPTLLLDVTDIIEDSPRQCTVCGKLADFECKECYGQCGVGLESIAFCLQCLEKVHRHERRTNHEPKKLIVPMEFAILQEHCPVPRLYLELSAVVCIETSHYVSFVKCGSGSEAPWCFFDSMADRKGEQNGYNIPEMVPCPDFPYWLSEEGASYLTELTDDRYLPEHAKRLLCDAYMCMYQSPDVMMYK